MWIVHKKRKGLQLYLRKPYLILCKEIVLSLICHYSFQQVQTPTCTHTVTNTTHSAHCATCAHLSARSLILLIWLFSQKLLRTINWLQTPTTSLLHRSCSPINLLLQRTTACIRSEEKVWQLPYYPGVRCCDGHKHTGVFAHAHIKTIWDTWQVRLKWGHGGVTWPCVTAVWLQLGCY